MTARHLKLFPFPYREGKEPALLIERNAFSSAGSTSQAKLSAPHFFGARNGYLCLGDKGPKSAFRAPRRTGDGKRSLKKPASGGLISRISKKCRIAGLRGGGCSPMRTCLSLQIGECREILLKCRESNKHLQLKVAGIQ
jgi:hypothetical protein